MFSVCVLYVYVCHDITHIYQDITLALINPGTAEIILLLSTQTPLNSVLLVTSYLPVELGLQDQLM